MSKVIYHTLTCGAVSIGDRPSHAVAFVSLNQRVCLSGTASELCLFFDRVQSYLAAKDCGAPVQYPFLLLPGKPDGSPEVRVTGLTKKGGLHVACGRDTTSVSDRRMRELSEDFEAALKAYGGRDKVMLSDLQQLRTEEIN